MYTISDLQQALSDPRLFAIEFNRIFHGLRFRSQPYNQNGVDIPSSDWDNLIILDACRYDAFESISDELPGELSTVESKGSATRQFLKANFKGRDMTDTVYITANPNFYKAKADGALEVEFHDEINVWRNGWHDEYRTVMPERVTEAVFEAAENYPNKRLLIHYLQPHAPFVGPTGIEQLPTTYLNFWGNLRKGEFDADMKIVKKAYYENLEIVIPYVKNIITSTRGKTVVTSDHGELFGERDSPIPIRRYGHPSMNTHIPELVIVPWHVYQKNKRKNIISEHPVDQSETDGQKIEQVKQRLEYLGYK